MENKYLNKLKTPPDLLIKYQGQTDRYSFSVLNSQWFKDNLKYESRLGYFSQVHKPYVIGWVASAKHPKSPFTIWIYFGIWTLEQHNIADIISNSDFVTLYRLYDYENELYDPKHDLFIYNSEADAIQAGLEMQEINNKETKKQSDMKETNYFTDKLNEVLNNPKVKECYNNLNDAVNDFLNDEKTKLLCDDVKKLAKDTVSITDVLAGDMLNSKVVKELEKQYKEFNPFIDRAINKISEKADKFTVTATKIANAIKDALEEAVNDVKKDEPNCSKHTFVKCIRVKDNLNKIILSKCASKNTAIYTARINDKKYDIDKNQYEDLFLVLTNTEGEKPEYIMNSVKDILGIPWIKDFKKDCEKECKKDRPIQFVQFREQDVIKHESQPNKRKFKLGDSAIYRKTQEPVKIEETYKYRDISNKQRLQYLVRFENNIRMYCYSWELDKC